MSATKPGRGLASPDSRRRPRATRSKPPRMPLSDSDRVRRPGRRRAGLTESPTRNQRTCLEPDPDRRTRTETWWESVARAERARAGRLRSLWQMTPAQRVAAMRRGELTYEQLAAWSARHPDEVPTVHGEFEWIVAKLAEVCE